MDKNGNRENSAEVFLSQKFSVSISADNRIAIENPLFDLLICKLEVWINGKPVNANAEERLLPFMWAVNQKVFLRCNQTVRTGDSIKVIMFDAETGPVVFSSETKPDQQPTADHRRSIFQLFHKDFQLDLLVDARSVLGKTHTQKLGFSFYPFSSSFDYGKLSQNNRKDLINCLQSVKPALLGLAIGQDPDDATVQSFCDLCNQLGCDPVIRFSPAESNLEQILETLTVADEQLSKNEGRRATLFVSLSRPENMKIPTGSICEAILAMHPNAVIFLNDPLLFRAGGIASSPLREKIEAGKIIPALSWLEPGPAGWFKANAVQEKDFASALPRLFEQHLKRIKTLFRSDGIADTVRIAIEPWAFFRTPTALTAPYNVNFSAQDAFYFAGMVNRMMLNNNLVSHALIGPLVGDAGLLRIENGSVFPSAAFSFFQLIQDMQENILRIETLPNHPIPTYHWSGLAGTAEAMDLPIVEAFASRSNDGTRLFLTVLNRDPRKRAVIRVSFRNFEEMRPLKAGVIRRNRKNDRNFSSSDRNVIYGEVSLRKYRRMDHVNLDIPASGIANMVLTTDP